MNLEEYHRNELLFVGFNQDNGCFACGTLNGFRIYNCEPFKETFRRDFAQGGIGFVEMLFRSNILALVGGGNNPKFPPNKVIIWDDHQNRCIGELSFRSEVKAVKLRRDKIVVVLEYKVYIYNFADLKLVESIETVSNPRGICAVCPSSTNLVLACPGVQRGQVRIDLFEAKKTTTILAHEAALLCLGVNSTGTRIATASEKGTLIRIWDTESGDLLQELRRGAEKAEVCSISFNPSSSWICVSSDKGTIHIFSLLGSVPQNNVRDQENTSKENSVQNPKSSLFFLSDFLPKYFSGEWSFAQFRVGEGRAVACFGPEPNTVLVLAADGSFYKCYVDPVNGGQCVQQDFHTFLEAPK